jgi:hypothetical protein
MMHSVTSRQMHVRSLLQNKDLCMHALLMHCFHSNRLSHFGFGVLLLAAGL